MYDLTLTPEQLEFRDTVRGFVEKEVKPAALNPKRLEPFEKPLLAGALEKASQMGLRTLALSEEAGGAGADGLTAAIVMEELGAGDVDVACVLAHTAALGRILFDRLMTPAQRGRWLARFVEDEVERDDGDRVRVVSRHGSAELTARLNSGIRAGELFATFHTTRTFLNAVTGSRADRTTQTPEYKVTAVRIEKAR